MKDIEDHCDIMGTEIKYAILEILKNVKDGPLWLNRIWEDINKERGFFCSDGNKTSLPTVSRQVKVLLKEKLIRPQYVGRGRIGFGYIITKKGRRELDDQIKLSNAEIAEECASLIIAPLNCSSCDKIEDCMQKELEDLELSDTKKEEIRNVLKGNPEPLRKLNSILYLQELVDHEISENPTLKKLYDMIAA